MYQNALDEIGRLEEDLVQKDLHIAIYKDQEKNLEEKQALIEKMIESKLKDNIKDKLMLKTSVLKFNKMNFKTGELCDEYKNIKSQHDEKHADHDH